MFCTGKSLSEAFILTPTNPQYDKRLFIDLPVQYMKTTSSEHGKNMLCTEIDFDIQNNLCTQHSNIQQPSKQHQRNTGQKHFQNTGEEVDMG